MGQTGFGRAAQNRFSAGAGAEEFVMKYTVKEAVLGVFGMAVCGYFLEPAMSGGDMPGKAMFVSAMVALGFVGCGFLVVAGLLGKMKLKIDANGLTQGTLMGESHLAWQDIDGFEILTVNYNKSVFAKAKKSSMLSLAKKVSIPVSAFKSRNYELLNWTSAYRPDLAPHILAVMSTVGAKRLVKDLARENGAART
jgi:hypothetical protein